MLWLILKALLAPALATAVMGAVSIESDDTQMKPAPAPAPVCGIVTPLQRSASEKAGAKAGDGTAAGADKRL